MATGGLPITVLAAGEHTTKNRTSLEEPWCTTAGERYKARVWEDIRNLFQQDELTDVMLAAEGQSIPCHRVLLAAASKFFHDKFVVHPESVAHNLLDIEGIDFETLKAIVYFVYNGRIQLTLEKAEQLLPASVSLMLPELTNMCKDFLLHKLDNDQSACVDIHRIAKQNALGKAGEEAWNLMTEHFKEVSKHDAFKEMSQTDLQDYISDERLYVANENPVFEAVVTWVRHDVENRKDSFEKLMGNVKLLHCSKQFLVEIVRTEELMQTAICLRHLSDAMSHHMTSRQQFDTARRGYYIYMYNTLVAVYDDNAYTFKARESEWVVNTSSAGKWLRWSSACMTGDGIVITGGYDGKCYTQCWKLALPTMKWTALPVLNVARSSHATVCVGNQVYVLGGYNGGCLASVEYLDEQNKSWQVTSDIPSVLYCHTAVSYKHFIYVFGGGTSSVSSLATFRLDTVNKKWTRKPDMPGHCRYGSSVVYRDRIYVLGGNQGCTCMSYDPDQDQFQSHSKHAVNHYTPSAVLWKDRILLCGGENTSVIEEYNPDTDCFLNLHTLLL